MIIQDYWKKSAKVIDLEALTINKYYFKFSDGVETHTIYN